MKDSLKVTMNEYLPLRDVVFNTLRQGILKGELEPGERLMEVALAERLGVSRTPIREAIRKLELEGLVIMIPRKGAEVASISEKSMRDVLEVRRALEEVAVELACKRITPEQMEEYVKGVLKTHAPGGRYICATSNSVHSSAKPENFAAMQNAIHKYGKYRADGTLDWM